MSSPEFDSDLFCITIKLFKWYNLETKLLFLSFFKVLIEEADLNNQDDFKQKNFLETIAYMSSKRVENYMLSVVETVMRSES